MNLSTKARYGLRILLEIAWETRQARVAKGRMIAQAQGISESYMEQIMIPLRNAGYLSTTRGRQGGYSLARPPEQITVLEVVELLEGSLHLVPCVKDDNACPRQTTCVVTHVWKRLSEAMRHEAQGISLASLLEERQAASDEGYVI